MIKNDITAANYRGNSRNPWSHLADIRGLSVDDAWHKCHPWNLNKVDIQASIDGVSSGVNSEKFRLIVRDDGKEIGAVKKSYEVVQPYELMKRFNPLIESGAVELLAGGVLKDATRFVAVGRIKGSQQDVVPGDVVEAYQLFYAGLDGTLGVGMMDKLLRGVCRNGLAVMDSGSFAIRFRHTASVHAKIADADAVLAATVRSTVESVAAFKHLAKTKQTRQQQEVYIRRVILAEDFALPEDQISTKAQNKVNRVIELLDRQRGLDLVPAIRGTAWQAYNAVTEYITHEAGRNEDTRLESQWFGAGATLNKKALQLALN